MRPVIQSITQSQVNRPVHIICKNQSEKSIMLSAKFLEIFFLKIKQKYKEKNEKWNKTMSLLCPYLNQRKIMYNNPINRIDIQQILV